MYCIHCGNEIPDNSNFCNKCGFPISFQNAQQMNNDMKSAKSRKKTRNTKVWMIIATLAVIAVVIASFLIYPKVFPRYDWNDAKLSSILPEPQSKWGKLSSNTIDYLYLYVHHTSVDEYTIYVDACADKGFNIEVDKDDSSYTAFNTDGYKLVLYHYPNDNEMTISVEAPIDMQIIEWPTSNIASLLPIPKSKFGHIERNDAKGLSVYLGNTTYTDYNAYVIECETAGFTVNFQKQDVFFSAENSDGYQIHVNYQGCNVIYISIVEPQRSIDISFNSIDSEFKFSVYIDDSWELDVEIGQTKKCNIILGMGEHIIIVRSDDDWDMYDNYILTVTNDEALEFDVSCTKNKIEIGLSGELPLNDATDNIQASVDDNVTEIDEEDNSSSSNENTLETNNGSDSPFDPYYYAIIVCQSLKDSLNNPESIQIHEVYYLDAYWHTYYVDFSAMNQLGGYTRECYEVSFNKDSSLYSFSKVYDLPDIFEELDYEILDTDLIESSLE